MKTYFVYIISNKNHTVYYTWVTNNLERRIFEHMNKVIEWFTSKYNIYKLLFYNKFEDINEAIEYEKKIKKWSRIKKLDLIKSINPGMEEIII
jgi:putative endonuclease